MKPKRALFRLGVTLVLGAIVLLAVMSTSILYCTATIPTIYSITPNQGHSEENVFVNIQGDNFQSTPLVSLYGGGPYEISNFFSTYPTQLVRVSGNYAYVVTHNAYMNWWSLEIINITNPSNPTLG